MNTQTEKQKFESLVAAMIFTSVAVVLWKVTLAAALFAAGVYAAKMYWGRYKSTYVRINYYWHGGSIWKLHTVISHILAKATT